MLYNIRNNLHPRNNQRKFARNKLETMALTYLIKLQGDPNSLVWSITEDNARMIARINTDKDGNDKFAIQCEIYDGDKLLESGLLSDIFNGLPTKTAPPTAIKAVKTWPDMNVKAEPDKFVVSDDQMKALYNRHEYRAEYSNWECSGCSFHGTDICNNSDIENMFCTSTKRKDHVQINWKFVK
jgi:hypothetical protein